MVTFLEFEKPIQELQVRVGELRETADSGPVDIEAEVSKLETEVENTVNYEEQPQAYMPENGSSVSESLMPESLVQAPEPELVVARGSATDPVMQPEPLAQTVEPLTPAAEPTAPEPFRKQDWL